MVEEVESWNSPIPCMKGKGEESRNTVSTEETVKPGTTAGEAFEHEIDDKQTEK